MTAAGVVTECEFLLLNEDGDSVTPLGVTMLWNPADPFAVTLWFPKGEEWVLARELLVAALTSAAAGDGDVRFSEIDCPGCVLLTLDSPSGHAELHVRRADLIDFIMATEYVPAADPFVEFDKWLAEEMGTRGWAA